MYQFDLYQFRINRKQKWHLNVLYTKQRMITIISFFYVEISASASAYFRTIFRIRHTSLCTSLSACTHALVNDHYENAIKSKIANHVLCSNWIPYLVIEPKNLWSFPVFRIAFKIKVHGNYQCIVFQQKLINC